MLQLNLLFPVAVEQDVFRHLGLDCCCIWLELAGRRVLREVDTEPSRTVELVLLVDGLLGAVDVD